MKVPDCVLAGEQNLSRQWQGGNIAMTGPPDRSGGISVREANNSAPDVRHLTPPPLGSNTSFRDGPHAPSALLG
jgi:hypothetical protein